MPQLDNLTPDDCQVILTGLLELPAKFVHKTIKKVEAQFMTQGLLPQEDIPGEPLPAIPKE